MLNIENIISKFIFYLTNYTNIERLSSELRNVKKLDKETKATIMISAYNEGNVLRPEKSNLYQTLSLLQSQIDFDGKQVSNDLFEVLIIDNASTDNTSKIPSIFQKRYPKFKLLLSQEDTKGVEYAKKYGFDLTVYRFFESYKESLLKKRIPEYIIASIDADSEEIDRYWLAGIIEKTLSKDADCYGGETRFPKRIRSGFPKAISLLDEYTSLSSAFLWPVFGNPTPGVNCCFFPHSVVIAGGYNISFSKHAGDMYLGNKVVSLGGLSKPLSSHVVVSPRRFLQNPLAFVSGHAYKHGLIDIREEVNAKDLNLEEFRKAQSYRRKELARTQIILQSILKPNIVLSNKNEDFFNLLFVGDKNFQKFKTDLLDLLGNPILKSVDVLMERYSKLLLDSIFKRNSIQSLTNY